MTEKPTSCIIAADAPSFISEVERARGLGGGLNAADIAKAEMEARGLGLSAAAEFAFTSK